jgi:predicted ester cyclase
MLLTPPDALSLALAYTAAWNTADPANVAAFFCEDGRIVINNGTPWIGRKGVAQMASGFFADVPDLALVCDGVRVADDHVVYLWTFSGHHAGTRNPLKIIGWEEWDLDPAHKVAASRGWYDAADYVRQVAGAGH